MKPYRIAMVDEVKYLNDAQYHADVQVVKQTIERGLLVPVEPCVHGNYAPHVVDETIYNEFVYDNCPGGLADVKEES